MDTATFTSSVIASTAWPVAVVVIVLVFRKPIASALRNLRRIEHRGTAFEFGEKLEQATERAAEVKLELPADDKAEHPVPADLPPRLIVLEAWLRVEKELSSALRAVGGESVYNATWRNYRARQALVKSGLIQEEMWKLIDYLREMRNEAAHAPDFAISKNDALRYATLSESAVRFLADVNGTLRERKPARSGGSAITKP